MVVQIKPLLFTLILSASWFFFPLPTDAMTVSSAELTARINAIRLQSDLSPLTYNSKLEAAAAHKLAHMQEFQYFDHIAPDGTQAWQFIDQAGYGYQLAGENLARNYQSSDAIIQAWMNSPTHRANILDQRFLETGLAVGEYQDSLVAVQIFATPVKPPDDAPTYPNPLLITSLLTGICLLIWFIISRKPAKKSPQKPNRQQWRL